MTFSQFRVFKNKLINEEFHEHHEVQNDSIGAYEYNGVRGVDSRPDFNVGDVSLVLPFLLSDEDLELLKDRYEDDLKEAFENSSLAVGDEVDWEDLQLYRAKGDLTIISYGYQSE